WGGPGQGYDWPKQEHGIRIDHQGFVWFGGNHKDDGFILKFTRDGQFVMQIGKAGPRKGDHDVTQLGQPADIWIDPETNEAFVREWVFLKDTLGSGSVWDMYLWPDREQSFFVNVDGANNEFRVVRRADGEVVGSHGRYGRQAGQFYGVHNVAIDSRGNVFTTE